MSGEFEPRLYCGEWVSYGNDFEMETVKKFIETRVAEIVPEYFINNVVYINQPWILEPLGSKGVNNTYAWKYEPEMPFAIQGIIGQGSWLVWSMANEYEMDSSGEIKLVRDLSAISSSSELVKSLEKLEGNENAESVQNPKAESCGWIKVVWTVLVRYLRDNGYIRYPRGEEI